METALSLAPILAILAIGVVSPGPSFILVARTAVAISRAAAISSALGMAASAAILSVVALLGLNAVLQKIPAAYIGLKIVGGIYLLYLAYKTWRGASEPIRISESYNSSAPGLFRHSWLAAAVMLSNPKAAVQYGVIFAAMLPQSPSLALTAALPPAVFALEASWYLVVACALSAPRSRDAYLRGKAAIDRIVGGVLAFLGIKLLLSSK